MTLDAGLPVRFDPTAFLLVYGDGVIGPPPEVRTLDSIRSSLLDYNATGPEQLYTIAMDVAHSTDITTLTQSMLLLGVVAYNSGTIGREPIRSQGHIHAVSPHSGWRPPELFEIWHGRAIVYMQQSASDNAGICYAVNAGPGEWVIVPPGWPHMVINADPTTPMVFGAACDRGYAGFEYEEVRSHGGLAYFPILETNTSIHWQRNPRYTDTTLIEKQPDSYEQLLPRPPSSTGSIYSLMRTDSIALEFIPYPQRKASAWKSFVP